MRNASFAKMILALAVGDGSLWSSSLRSLTSRLNIGSIQVKIFGLSGHPLVAMSII
jgi:hypothetical protein